MRVRGEKGAGPGERTGWKGCTFGFNKEEDVRGGESLPGGFMGLEKGVDSRGKVGGGAGERGNCSRL